jgi:transcriptional regulator with XRE-family HTH domain
VRKHPSASTTFRIRLRELRQACRWTQERAAASCGIGYKLYQHYEIGIKKNPCLRTVEKIARGFGLSISEFLATGPVPRSYARKRGAAARTRAGARTRTRNRRC